MTGLLASSSWIYVQHCPAVGQKIEKETHKFLFSFFTKRRNLWTTMASSTKWRFFLFLIWNFFLYGRFGTLKTSRRGIFFFIFFYILKISNKITKILVSFPNYFPPPDGSTTKFLFCLSVCLRIATKMFRLLLLRIDFWIWKFSRDIWTSDTYGYNPTLKVRQERRDVLSFVTLIPCCAPNQKK